jgi:hypothetical protein
MSPIVAGSKVLGNMASDAVGVGMDAGDRATGTTVGEGRGSGEGGKYDRVRGTVGAEGKTAAGKAAAILTGEGGNRSAV